MFGSAKKKKKASLYHDVDAEYLCFPSIFEPHHDKTNKNDCAPSEDSDQPGHHPPSLIRVFAVRQWVAKDPNFFMRTAKALITLGGCPG